MLTNTESGTRIDEIAEGVHRISTPVPPSQIPGGFSFNQYLVLGDAPLLFHTGMRALFPLVSEAISRVMPLERLRYIGLGHFEADECGALNDFLAVAPDSVPVCSRVAGMTSVADFAIRPPRVLGDGESLDLGDREMVWIDTPHLPHNWEAGVMFDRRTATLLCGDLFTHGGHACPPLTSDDLIGPSEALRQAGFGDGIPDAYSLGSGYDALLARLAALQPRRLAVMHGSAYEGRTGTSCASMLQELGRVLAA
jgi:glyoxylase-like metal-dependent hydrolase (beta-lactamase superfamily II)